ncbi:MAG: hypothetical protein OXI67_13070 [Candidatus Poribacteria bacterium]|nr:hypothetical protein [Candidatus Poribacteria bacterium]
MWKTTQVLQTDTNQVKQELMQRLDAIQKISTRNTKKLNEMDPVQTSIQKDQKNIQSDIGQIREYLNIISSYLKNMNSDREIEDKGGDDNDVIHYHLEVEKTVQLAQKQVLTLVEAYKSGEPIDLVAIENPTPSQNVMIILNSMAYDLGKWRAELEQDKTVDPEFVQILINAERNIKDRLERIRSESDISPIPLDVTTDVSTEAELTHIRDQCVAHAARLEGVLSAYELGYQVDEEEYNQFIPQFIRYRLFNEVVDFIPFEDLPKKMEKFLRFLGYEVVPIELGVTKADSHVHDIRESRHTSGEHGTVIEIVSPGLRRKADGEIIQKPVVIRGE